MSPDDILSSQTLGLSYTARRLNGNPPEAGTHALVDGTSGTRAGSLVAPANCIALLAQHEY